MTSEDLEINVKICEILGYNAVWEPIRELMFPGPGKITGYKYSGPDYCNDLNAMQYVWEWLCADTGISEDEDKLQWEGRRTAYGEHLEDYAQYRCQNWGGSLSYVLANLTAREKATCFLKAMKMN